MAWCWLGDKPSSEPVMDRRCFVSGICVTRPQWVNGLLPANTGYVKLPPRTDKAGSSYQELLWVPVVTQLVRDKMTANLSVLCGGQEPRRFRWKLHASSQPWPLLFTPNRGETAIAKCGNLLRHIMMKCLGNISCIWPSEWNHSIYQIHYIGVTWALWRHWQLCWLFSSFFT